MSASLVHGPGLDSPTKLRAVSRGHVITWRDNLVQQQLSPATIRRKLAALSALFRYLCDNNAVAANPVEGYTAQSIRLTRLLQEPMVAKGDGRYPKLLASLAKVDVLILDDFGLNETDSRESTRSTGDYGRSPRYSLHLGYEPITYRAMARCYQ